MSAENTKKPEWSQNGAVSLCQSLLIHYFQIFCTMNTLVLPHIKPFQNVLLIDSRHNVWSVEEKLSLSIILISIFYTENITPHLQHLHDLQRMTLIHHLSRHVCENLRKPEIPFICCLL